MGFQSYNPDELERRAPPPCASKPTRKMQDNLVTPNGALLCGIIAKRTGKPCMRPVVRGRYRCTVHGGKSKMGAEAGRFVTGRYSKYMPARLVEAYNAAKEDPDWLGLKDEVAVLQARLVDQLSKVDNGESGKSWEDLREAVNRLGQSQRLGNPDAMALALDDIQMVVKRGWSDHAGWQDVRETIELIRRAKESERKRLVELQQMVSTERVLIMLMQLTESIRHHCYEHLDPVTAKKLIDLVADDIARVSNVPTGAVAAGKLAPGTIRVIDGK